MLVPALLVAGAANAAEIYNKDGNKVDFYGKMVGERIWSNTDDNNTGNEVVKPKLIFTCKSDDIYAIELKAGQKLYLE